MELDHLFMLVEQDAVAADRLAALGLVENGRKAHKGQGTANICYFFDNMYLELLWIVDEVEVRSPAISRTGLYERSGWRVNQSNPFGLAWRDSPEEKPSDLPCWNYSPPYLPAGMSLPISIDSDDLKQPLMFRSGRSAPIDWPADKRGDLQRPGGLTLVKKVDLMMPAAFGVSACLSNLAERTILNVQHAETSTASLVLHIKRSTSSDDLQIMLPECRKI